MSQTKYSLVSRVINGPSPQQTDLDVGEGKHIKKKNYEDKVGIIYKKLIGYIAPTVTSVNKICEQNVPLQCWFYKYKEGPPLVWGVGDCGLPCTGPAHYSAHCLETEEDSNYTCTITYIIICTWCCNQKIGMSSIEVTCVKASLLIHST